jgi:adrenodoxin-NADP+ reductase
VGNLTWTMAHLARGTSSLRQVRARVRQFSSAPAESADGIPGFERVAIVGAGPAGLFAARRLITPRTGGSSDVKVDFFEVLPAPFGLSRYGIAPDHQEAKRVQYSNGNFTDTANNDQVDYLGNVEVGKHITLAELRRHYNAVLLTYGSIYLTVLHHTLHTLYSYT